MRVAGVVSMSFEQRARLSSEYAPRAWAMLRDKAGIPEGTLPLPFAHEATHTHYMVFLDLTPDAEPDEASP